MVFLSKKIFTALSFLILVTTLKLSAQVAIGTINPSDATLLQIGGKNATGGFLIPKIYLPSIGNRAPITGAIEESLLVYNTNPDLIGGKGFYYWRVSGSRWNYLTSGIENVYTISSSLENNRTITANSYSLNILSDIDQSAFSLKKQDPAAEIGFSFRNSGNFYDASFVLTAAPNANFTINTGLNQRFADDLEPTLVLKNDRSLNLPEYADGSVTGTLINYLGINTAGEVVELNQNLASSVLNNDWYLEDTTIPPSSIDENIYTNGNVSINKTSSLATLNILDQSGEVASFNSGTILLEKNDNAENSIVFKSNNDSNTDFGFIKYYPSSADGTGANNVLELGVNNDTPNSNVQDDVNINSSGSLGINNNTPAVSSSIDLARTNQGFWVNRVTLNSTTDANTIVGAEPDGLLVYNSTTAGSGSTAVTEGFYYWDNNRWNAIKPNNPNYNMGMQYYSYNISTSTSPDLFTIETSTIASKMGYYGGNLTGTAGFATMKPSNNDGFIIKMTGSLYAENPGVFNFNVAADDGYRIYVDGSLIVNFWSAASGGNDNIRSGGVNLKKGIHKVTIYYFQYTGPSRFTFTWGANPDGKTGTIKATDFFVN